MITGVGKTREVFVNGTYLSPRASQKAYNHSPDGFSWGYPGSGPAQLALALLMAFGDKDQAIARHQIFKRDIIAQLPKDADFELTEDEVFNWMRDHGMEVRTGAPYV